MQKGLEWLKVYTSYQNDIWLLVKGRTILTKFLCVKMAIGLWG